MKVIEGRCFVEINIVRQKDEYSLYIKSERSLVKIIKTKLNKESRIEPQ